MLTKNARKKLMEIFGYDSWKELREDIKEAKHPYPYKISWRSIAKGKHRDGRECIHSVAIKGDPNVDESCVFEEYTYIRFVGSHFIYRYQTSTETKGNLKDYDIVGESDLEEGDMFVAEPMTLARSHEYSKNRREAIKDGTWKVKPRGPNANMRRNHPHHFRSY